MKHIQLKTMMVMKAALSANRFSQLGLRKLCGNSVSAGQVSKVITELQRLGYVERSTGPDGSRYVLADPVGLLRYVALFRRMDELRAFRVKVAAHEELVIEELGGKGAIFCLGTAMARYSAYYRPGEVSFYADDPAGIKNYLETAQPGNTLVCCYGSAGPAMPLEGNFTDRVQTVIDMFCDGKGAYAKPLLRELWGVEI